MLNITVPADLIASPERIENNRRLFSELVGLITPKTLFTVRKSFKHHFNRKKLKSLRKKLIKQFSHDISERDCDPNLKIIGREVIKYLKNKKGSRIFTDSDFHSYAEECLSAITAGFVEWTDITLTILSEQSVSFTKKLTPVDQQHEEKFSATMQTVATNLEIPESLCLLVLKNLGKKIIERCSSTGEPYVLPLNITIEYRADEKILVAKRMMAE